MDETHLCPALCIRLAKCYCCFMKQSVLGLGVLFDPTAPFEVAASAVLITCPADPWVNARSWQWRGWYGHAQRFASLVLIPELFQLTATGIWSCALLVPLVLQYLAQCLIMRMSSCLILVVYVYLFIYSYHGELDHLSVNHHRSSLLGFALLEVSLPAIP